MFSLAGLLGLANMASQLMNFVNQLNKDLENARNEARQHFGQDVDVEVVLLKEHGKGKIGIIVDFPGDVEEPLWALANSFGLRIRKIEVR